MNRARLFTLASLIALAIAGRGGEEAFRGIRGEGLLRSVREECRPSQYVADPYQWISTHDVSADGQLLLLLEGERADSPADVTMVQVMPTDWWQYDPQLKSLPARDLQNLMASTLSFGAAKGAYPPFRVDNPLRMYGYAAVGTVQFGTETTGAWQPADDMKGDVARIAMYMLAVYPAAQWDPWCSLLYSGAGFSSQGLAMMLKWSREDPVDEREVRRARAVAEAQGAEVNPFVAYPGFEEYLWGTKAGEPFPDDLQSHEKSPLRSSYTLADDRIWLYSPFVNPDATWRVDGAVAGESIAVASLSLGNHLIEFTEPDGSRGSVTITVTE